MLIKHAFFFPKHGHYLRKYNWCQLHSAPVYHGGLCLCGTLHWQSQRRNTLSFKCHKYEVSPTGSSAATHNGVHSYLMPFHDQTGVTFAVKDFTDFFFFFCVSFCFCKSSNFMKSLASSLENMADFLGVPKINIDTS